MAQHKVVLATVRGEANTALIEQGLAGLDYELDVQFCSNDGETIEAVKGADLILNSGVQMGRKVIEEIDKAQGIISSGHGFNQIDEIAATDHGIMVVNCAGFCSEEVSNHNIMMILALGKNLVVLDRQVRTGWWWKTQKELLPMPPIDRQTLGMVGFGNISRPTCRKAKVLGMEVITYDPYCPPWIAHEYRVELVPSLEELARRSDFVCMQVPLNSETRKLVGESFFRAMKPTAFFINTCRGPTVDEQALIKALQNGEIAGAGIDVFEQEPLSAANPLLKMDNVIVTPHSAGTSDLSIPASRVRVGQEAARILKGMMPMSLANPDVRSKLASRPMAVNQ